MTLNLNSNWSGIALIVGMVTFVICAPLAHRYGDRVLDRLELLFSARGHFDEDA